MLAKLQSPVSSEFFFLNDIRDPKTTEIFAKIILNLFTQITDNQNQLVYFRRQNINDALKKRLAANLNHRFGSFKRQGTHSESLAGGQNYTFHNRTYALEPRNKKPFLSVSLII